MPFITLKLTNVEEILVNSRNSFLTVLTDCCCKPETVRNTKGANCERFKPLCPKIQDFDVTQIKRTPIRNAQFVHGRGERGSLRLGDGTGVSLASWLVKVG